MILWSLWFRFLLEREDEEEEDADAEGGRRWVDAVVWRKRDGLDGLNDEMRTDVV